MDQASREEGSDAGFPIVGIGASAGGIEAITQLLSHLPDDTGMAFVIVQHLAPSHPSLLTDVLLRTTKMPVSEATHAAAVEPNHVYVIPPSADLVLHGGVLELHPRATDAPRPYLPIDVFFRSLADARKTTAIGVVLSGTAADGTEGLKAIKAEAGITFAQDPRTAKYPIMPENAIAAGAVDIVLGPAEIAGELARIARHPYVRPGAPSEEPEDASRGIGKICELLAARTGVDFARYKPSTVRRRIARRMTLNKIERYADYLALLHGNPAEIRSLSEDMLIHVTGFFRDAKAFDALAERVLPELLEHKAKDTLSLRVWVPGCSTGEEAYSIAIVIAEALGDALHRGSIQIFGSDISAPAIDRARTGIYPESIARDVSEPRLQRFFTKVDRGYRISKVIRDLCVFVRHDVTRDPPFTRLDLISCRNLLIYFSADLQKKVVPLFHYALNDQGFLLLGMTETIGAFGQLFALEDRTHKIYKRKPAPRRLAATFPAALRPEPHPGPGTPKLPDATSTTTDLQREVDRVLLARYGRPAVIVNEALDIVSTRGHTARFLELPPGEARLNVLSMAREGLLSDLRLALHRVRKDGATVRREATVSVDGQLRSVEIEVSSLQLARAGRERLFLVVFDELPVATRATSAKPRERKSTRTESRAESRVIAKLREELDGTKAYVQSVIEDHANTNQELASANEELLSSNEELQSTNEELETAKEELQSANEELSTVNDELHSRNAELTQANNDLANVMGSIEVPIVLVGLDQRIRRFTPSAADKLHLIASDVGRPIRDINPDLELEDFHGAIAHVIATIETKQTEVRDRGGHWWRLEIRPYKTTDSQIDGAVISLVDIDAPKRALDERERLLEQIRHEREFLQAVVQQLPAGVMIADAPSGKVILSNHRVIEILGPPQVPFGTTPAYNAYRGIHADGQPFKPDDWPLARSLQRGELVIGEQNVVQRTNGSFVPILATSAPIRDERGTVIAGVLAFVDLSPEAEARARTDREQTLLAQAGSLLADLFDIDKTLQSTVRIVVRHLADWCIVDLVEDDRLRQAAVGHADPDKEKLARQLARTLPPDPELEHGVGHVLRTRRSELYPVVTDVGWVASALSVAHPSILRDLGARSYICVPLVARDQLVGVVSLIRGEGSERYDERSLRVAEELGHRIAIAIDNARLHATTLEAVRVRNEFFSVAAHELRTPMSALMLQVQQMRLSAERTQAPDAVQIKSLKLVERQVRRLDQLVNTLLDVSRIASGRFEIERQELDFAELVKEVAARFEDPGTRAGSELSVHAQGPIDGSWDRLRLEQVVTNLLTNALKYGAGKPVEVSLDADAKTVRLAVRDHGIGIAREDLERIFEQFERAVPSRNYAGLGMGLFITRQIVDAHGGTIRATSVPDQGSTFTVELPRWPPDHERR